MNSNKNILLNSIWQLITIILGFHYYLSYRWINGLLEIHDLDELSIITIQDVMFPFVELNYTIIGLSSIGFTVVFFLKLFLKKTTYLNVDIIVEKKIKKAFKNLFKDQPLKKIIVNLILFLVFSVSTIILVVKYFQISESGRFYIFWFLILLILIPAIYVIGVKKRPLILGLFLFVAFFWAIKFVDKILIVAENSDPKTTTSVSFKYHNKNIKTNECLVFLYRSYKFLILRDEITNKNLLFENENVRFLEISKKKISANQNTFGKY